MIKIIKDNDIVIAFRREDETNYLLTYEATVLRVNATRWGETHNAFETYDFARLVYDYDIFVFSDKEFYSLISGE